MQTLSLVFLIFTLLVLPKLTLAVDVKGAAVLLESSDGNQVVFASGNQVLPRAAESIIQAYIGHLPDSPQNQNISLSLCENESEMASDQKCSNERFIGSLSPFSIDEMTFFVTARHVLNSFKNGGQIRFQEGFDSSEYQIFEFHTDNNIVADLVFFVPKTFFDECSNTKKDPKCLTQLQNLLLDHFQEPVKENTYWIAVQPNIGEGVGTKISPTWNYSFGFIKSSGTVSQYSRNANSPVPLLELVRNDSNHSAPGSSGTLIRPASLRTAIFESK